MKSKQPLLKSKKPFLKSKSKQSFRRCLPPIGAGDQIGYRNISLIRRFISDDERELSKRVNRFTLIQQRLIALAIKQARILALLPFFFILIKKRNHLKEKDPSQPLGIKIKKDPRTIKKTGLRPQWNKRNQNSKTQLG